MCFDGFNQVPNQGAAGAFGRVQALKIAYMTRQLNLTPDESTRFWPIYYSYTDELNRIRKETKNDVIGGDEKLLDVKKRYWGQFKSVLGTDVRVNKFFLTEREFGNYIRKEMEARQKMRQQLRQQVNP